MATKAKQIVTLGSSIVFVIMFVFCYILIAQNRNISTVVNEVDKSTIDTSINKLILRDTTSIIKNIGDVSHLIIDDFDKGECVILANADKNEFVIMRREYGGFENQYDYFFLSKHTAQIDISKIKVLIDSHFITNKGAFLNMQEKDFLSKYTNVNFQQNITNDTIIYHYIDANMSYECNYYFVDKVLVEINFGYQY